MSDPTQASAGPDAPPPAATPAAGDATGPGGPPADGRAIQLGLLWWLLTLVAGGVGCVVLGHVEGALLFAGAGAFALAQASDTAATLERYRRFVDAGLPPDRLAGRLVRGLVGALVPLAGALFYAGFGAWAWRGEEAPATFAALWCAGATLACLALAWRPLADAVAITLFRGPSGRTRRLTARIVVMTLLLPPPALQVAPALLQSLAQSGTPLADAGGLFTQLLGELAIALAGVGLFVRRDWRAVRERLGLMVMRRRHLAVAAGGVLAAIALNGVTGWVEQHAFPGLWKQDSDVTGLIAGHLSLATSLLLGVSAGVGEEIVVRGALQPRLGVPLSALVFACGHVQYSWFGMLTVGLLGVLLGAIRARTNTTTAIVVHALYDIYAVFTAG